MAETLLTQESDPLDFTGRYNTKLSAKEQAAFMSWAAKQSKKLGRDVLQDMYDYDLQGAWKAGFARSENGHLPDTFKKPNHPTFSDQSQYNGADGIYGGSWGTDAEGRDTFTPGRGALWDGERLGRYFQEVEPNAVLLRAPAPRSEGDIASSLYR